jgi:hypothetical protein
MSLLFALVIFFFSRVAFDFFLFGMCNGHFDCVDCRCKAIPLFVAVLDRQGPTIQSRITEARRRPRSPPSTSVAASLHVHHLDKLIAVWHPYGESKGRPAV